MNITTKTITDLTALEHPAVRGAATAGDVFANIERTAASGLSYEANLPMGSE